MKSNQRPISPLLLSSLRVRLAQFSAWTLAGILLGILCFELVGIAARYWSTLAIFWVGDVLPLALLSMGWVGAGHLWLQRDHLIVGSLVDRSGVWHRRVWMLSDVIMIFGVVWLLPQIRTAIVAYDSMFLPALEISASVKYFPMFLGLVFLGVAAVLNLLDAFLGIEHQRDSFGSNGS